MVLVTCWAAGAQQRERDASWQIGPFVRPADAKPVIVPKPEARFTDPILHKEVSWEALHTFNPAAVVRHGKVVVLYRAEDNSGVMGIGEHTSRLGMAESTDGVHFEQGPEPVFYPGEDAQKGREWPGGVEDPRLVEAPDGSYVLTYTQWNRTTYSIGIATSQDLVHWVKHGPALGEAGKYGGLMYKSGGILTQVVDGRLVAAKVKGRFWMYWGEIEVRLASSDDLIHWTPVEGKDGKPVVLLGKRPARFDSALPEVGPPPVLTAKGIVLVYNGENAAQGGAAGLQAGVYSVGQALFAGDEPGRLLARTDEPLFQPEMQWEKSGQYAAGTTFAEGMVWFSGRWMLYYGCADSLVGVALEGR